MEIPHLVILLTLFLSFHLSLGLQIRTTGQQGQFGRRFRRVRVRTLVSESPTISSSVSNSSSLTPISTSTTSSPISTISTTQSSSSSFEPAFFEVSIFTKKMVGRNISSLLDTSGDLHPPVRMTVNLHEKENTTSTDKRKIGPLPPPTTTNSLSTTITTHSSPISTSTTPSTTTKWWSSISPLSSTTVISSHSSFPPTSAGSNAVMSSTLSSLSTPSSVINSTVSPVINSSSLTGQGHSNTALSTIASVSPANNTISPNSSKLSEQLTRNPELAKFVEESSSRNDLIIRSTTTSSECQAQLERTDECIRSVLMVKSENVSLPRTFEEIDQLYCRNLNETFKCLSGYSKCLSRVPRIIYSWVYLHIKRTIQHDVCHHEHTREDILYHGMCFRMDTSGNGTHNHHHHHHTHNTSMIRDILDKGTVMSMYVLERVPLKDLIPWGCCGFYTMFDVGKQLVDHYCHDKTGNETGNFVMHFMKSAANELLDFACRPKYDSVENCEKNSPSAMKILRQLTSGEVPRQKYSPIIPLIKIAERLAGDHDVLHHREEEKRNLTRTNAPLNSMDTPTLRIVISGR